jgi:hypothetical protein
MKAPIRPAKRNVPGSPKLRALELLGRWTRLAQGHVFLGAGCSCGVGPGSVPVADFEQDILAYLRSRHGGSVGDRLDLAHLLRAIASGQGGAGSAALLNDLEQSIESFERAHRV